MHKFMHDNLFKIFLLWIDNVQQQNSFSVITVYFDIPRLVSADILDKLQPHIPER